jgi:hypothetical protein
MGAIASLASVAVKTASTTKDVPANDVPLLLNADASNWKLSWLAPSASVRIPSPPDTTSVPW